MTYDNDFLTNLTLEETNTLANSKYRILDDDGPFRLIATLLVPPKDGWGGRFRHLLIIPEENGCRTMHSFIDHTGTLIISTYSFVGPKHPKKSPTSRSLIFRFLDWLAEPHDPNVLSRSANIEIAPSQLRFFLCSLLHLDLNLNYFHIQDGYRQTADFDRPVLSALAMAWRQAGPYGKLLDDGQISISLQPFNGNENISLPFPDRRTLVFFLNYFNYLNDVVGSPGEGT